MLRQLRKRKRFISDPDFRRFLSRLTESPETRSNENKKGREIRKRATDKERADFLFLRCIRIGKQTDLARARARGKKEEAGIEKNLCMPGRRVKYRARARARLLAKNIIPHGECKNVENVNLSIEKNKPADKARRCSSAIPD